MVCLGNICRSPLAQGILASLVDPEKVLVDSAGTAGYHLGKAPDHRSIALALERGLDISHQRCRKVTTDDLRDFDLIYAMDRKNLEGLLRQAEGPRQAIKVKLLLEEVDLGLLEVPDPYYGERRDFEKVYEILEKACGAIAKKLN